MQVINKNEMVDMLRFVLLEIGQLGTHNGPLV